MKILKAVLFLIAIGLIHVSIEAQTKDEYHTRITKHHFAITESADKFNGDKVFANDFKMREADIMGTHLTDAQSDHLSMHKNLSDKHKDTVKENHEALKKYHAQALESHKSLKEELAKPTPDETKVKMHAKRIKENIIYAEEEHKKIGRKTGNPMM